MIVRPYFVRLDQSRRETPRLLTSAANGGLAPVVEAVPPPGRLCLSEGLREDSQRLDANWDHKVSTKMSCFDIGPLPGAGDRTASCAFPCYLYGRASQPVSAPRSELHMHQWLNAAAAPALIDALTVCVIGPLCLSSLTLTKPAVAGTKSVVVTTKKRRTVKLALVSTTVYANSPCIPFVDSVGSSAVCNLQ